MRQRSLHAARSVRAISIRKGRGSLRGAKVQFFQHLVGDCSDLRRRKAVARVEGRRLCERDFTCLAARIFKAKPFIRRLYRCIGGAVFPAREGSAGF